MQNGNSSKDGIRRSTTSSLASLASAVLESLASGYVQHRRVLKLTTPLGEDALLAESLRGSEGLSEGFRLEVAALALEAAIPLKTLIGQPVQIELLTDSVGASRAFHGHVTSAELSGANGGFARYRLVVEPWTRFLSLGRVNSTRKLIQFSARQHFKTDTAPSFFHASRGQLRHRPSALAGKVVAAHQSCLTLPFQSVAFASDRHHMGMVQ